MKRRQARKISKKSCLSHRPGTLSRARSVLMMAGRETFYSMSVLARGKNAAARAMDAMGLSAAALGEAVRLMADNGTAAIVLSIPSPGGRVVEVPLFNRQSGIVGHSGDAPSFSRPRL